MPLRDLLIHIADVYDATALASNDVPGQALLRGVKERHDLPLPPGFTADGHGGQGFASSTPWIGVYDPAINTEPHDGLYLAYIFSEDLSAVTLTLQQGVTSLKKSFPDARTFGESCGREHGAYGPRSHQLWRQIGAMNRPLGRRTGVPGRTKRAAC
ncbi:hypothetical protein SVIOM74S_02408 [Streptomyces violarus]